MSNGIELWCPSVKAKVDKIKKVQINVLRKVVQDSSLIMKLNIAHGLKLELVFGVRPFHFMDNVPSRLALENLLCEKQLQRCKKF